MAAPALAPGWPLAEGGGAGPEGFRGEVREAGRGAQPLGGPAKPGLQSTPTSKESVSSTGGTRDEKCRHVGKPGSFGTVEPASCKAPCMNWYLIVRPTIGGPQIRPMFWSERDTAILVLQAFARSDDLGTQLFTWDSGMWRPVQQQVYAPYGFP
jgi:hypothetical protein